MSTDLTMTLVVWESEGLRGEGGAGSGLRFICREDGTLTIRGSMPAGRSDSEGFSMMHLTEDDAIMLRDWLNDEWPVAKRDDYSVSAAAAMQADIRDPLWGRDPGTSDGPEYPLNGCECDNCVEARRNG